MCLEMSTPVVASQGVIKMKVIAIYSGKGGVGKTTVSSMFALALAKEYGKVALLDFDINTPSTPVIFGGRNEIENLKIFSTGFGKLKTLGFTGSHQKQVLKGLAKEVKEFNPDVCIIDMPPSTSEIHLQVCKSLKPSAFVLVSQPNKLCEDDAVRATQLFLATKIPIVGVIQNMVGEYFGEKESNILGLPNLATLTLNKDIADAGQQGKLDEIKENPLTAVAKDIVDKAEVVEWSLECINNWGGLGIEAVKQIPYEDLGYYGLNSWDFVRDELSDRQVGFNMYDEFLSHNNSETIRRVLENLDEDKEGFFMVIRPPNTEISVFSGEIGSMRLVLAKDKKDYYGVPRLEYATDDGNLILFPHEVKPITQKEYLQYKNDDEYGISMNSNAPRLLPQLHVMEELQSVFGLHKADWKKDYEKLNVKLN